MPNRISPSKKFFRKLSHLDTTEKSKSLLASEVGKAFRHHDVRPRILGFTLSGSASLETLVLNPNEIEPSCSAHATAGPRSRDDILSSNVQWP